VGVSVGWGRHTSQVDAFPNGVKAKTHQGLYALHALCANPSVDKGMLACLLDWYNTRRVHVVVSVAKEREGRRGGYGRMCVCPRCWPPPLPPPHLSKTGRTHT
jgi:hypothetical protein